MARPKVRSSNGHFPDQTEELSCGYIMHQHKKVGSKMRWGKLLTGKDDDGQNCCIITLFKFDIVNPKPGIFAKKDLKLKSSFEFNEDDFCGLEKGEHLNRHGKKRFICVILKDKHIILEDAVIAMTDTDHDVIGTWYRKITEAMQYMYRWQILGSTGSKYLHISRVNTCECYTVHNSNAGQKGKLLLDHLYKTMSIVKVDEYLEMWDGVVCTRVTFYEVNHGMNMKISLLLESGKKLSEVLRNAGQNHRPTLAERFDLLTDGHHNLMKVTPTPKADRPPPESLKDLSLKVRPPETNNYIDNNPPNAPSMYSNQENGHTREPVSETRLPPRRLHPEDMHPRRASPHRNFPPHEPGNYPPQNHKPAPRHHDDIRPHRDSMDDPKNVTRTSQVDSGYYTKTSVTSETNVSESVGLSTRDSLTNYENFEGPYINVPNQPSLVPSLHSSHLSTSMAQTLPSEPPVIPPRVPTGQQNPEISQNDLVAQAFQNQEFPPISDHPDIQHQGYENHTGTGIAVTISTLLERNDIEPVDTSFGLPYSTFRELLLGLEAQTTTGGDWRGLANELGMTFHEVEQIETAVFNHPQLFALQIVLLQWQRAQAPVPCTLSNLKEILAKKLGRTDLANMIFVSEKKGK